MLTYLTTTRPDIAYVVHVVSQFMHAPCTNHFFAILRIIRYLRGTLHHGLLFSSHSLPILSAYFDAEWANVTNCKPTTGFLLFLGDSLISWKSKKQYVVYRFNVESEYWALVDTTFEIIWLHQLLLDLGAQQS